VSRDGRLPIREVGKAILKEFSGKLSPFSSSNSSTPARFRVGPLYPARPNNLSTWLLYYGAHVIGTGALHSAISRNDVEMLDLLLERGIDVNENPPYYMRVASGSVFDLKRAREMRKKCKHWGKVYASPLHVVVRF